MTDLGREPAEAGDATRVSDATAVLLLDPPMGRQRRRACLDDLRAAGAEAPRVCRVEFSGSVDAWFAEWEPSPPAACEVVNATGVSWSDPSATLPSWVTSVSETGPSNLTQIGTAVTGFLDRHGGAEGRALVCVHSLTTLLQYVGTRQAFRFLHQLTEQASARGAFVHVHLAAGVHDEQTVNLFTTLADGVVRVERGDTPADATS